MNILVEIIKLIDYILIGTNNISIIIITIVAGVFGFIIAAIPLTIQLLEIKENKIIKKINENKIMKKKIFDNYINTLKSAFFLVIVILLLEIFKNYIQIYIYVEIFIFIFYISLIYKFLNNLYILIGILKELALTYLDIYNDQIYKK